MRAVIQAGGKGSRLRNITKDEIPKPMVPVLGKPLLQWQIEQLKKGGITEVLIVIGYLGQTIREHFRDGRDFGVSITYIEELQPLGTAGGLYYLRQYVKDEEDLLFIYGDLFFDIDLERMEKFHRDKRSELTAFAHPNDHPFDSDLIELDAEERIIRLLPKGEKRKNWYGNVVNAGCYIMNAGVIQRLTKIQKLDFEKDILFKMIKESAPVFGYRSTEYIKDCGTEERLCKIEKDIRNRYVENRNLTKKQKCIFLDRDGTITRSNGLIDDENKLELIDCAVEAIRKINSSEFLAIVVTNQPVVARGMCTIEGVRNIHKKLETLLGESGVYLDDLIFCPHHPDKGFPEENPIYKVKCNCRKPGIGMIEEMRDKYNISLEDSWIVGDTTVDLMTGINAGMKTALVLTGEAGEDGKYRVEPDLIGTHIQDVINKIINVRK